MKRSQTQEKLIVFTRYPEPGTTKTRLAKTLGGHKAAAIQKKLTEHTMLQVIHLVQSYPVSVSVLFEGGSREKMQEWLGPDLNYQHQEGEDLGQRMAHAFTKGFRDKFKRIVIIGTDCPFLKADHLKQAFDALRHQELVLGPASDGGYYLIGLSRAEKSLFEDISWGTDTVLVKTLSIAAALGLTTDLLETLSDVDRQDDLKHINNHPDL